MSTNRELEVKIADFGLATLTPSNPFQMFYDKCGTPCYIAPEVLREIGYREKADIFSLGSTFFNIVSGFYLFYSKDVSKQIKNNTECNLGNIDECLGDCSLPCRDLLLKMLIDNPEGRPTAKQALLHPWFSEDKYIIEDLLVLNREVANNVTDANLLL